MARIRSLSLEQTLVDVKFLLKQAQQLRSTILEKLNTKLSELEQLVKINTSILTRKFNYHLDYLQKEKENLNKVLKEREQISKDPTINSLQKQNKWLKSEISFLKEKTESMKKEKQLLTLKVKEIAKSNQSLHESIRSKEFIKHRTQVNVNSRIRLRTLSPTPKKLSKRICYSPSIKRKQTFLIERTSVTDIRRQIQQIRSQIHYESTNFSSLKNYCYMPKAFFLSCFDSFTSYTSRKASPNSRISRVFSSKPMIVSERIQEISETSLGEDLSELAPTEEAFSFFSNANILKLLLEHPHVIVQLRDSVSSNLETKSKHNSKLIWKSSHQSVLFE